MDSVVTPTLVELVSRLRDIVGADGVIASPRNCSSTNATAMSSRRKRPDVVVFPTTTEQVAAVVKLCNEFDVPFVPRGAGTAWPAVACRSAAA